MKGFAEGNNSLNIEDLSLDEAEVVSGGSVTGQDIIIAAGTFAVIIIVL